MPACLSNYTFSAFAEDAAPVCKRHELGEQALEPGAGEHGEIGLDQRMLAPFFQSPRRQSNLYLFRRALHLPLHSASDVATQAWHPVYGKGCWPHHYTAPAQLRKAALILVDAQAKYDDTYAPSKKPMQALLEAFRAADLPVFWKLYTRNGQGFYSRGDEFIPELAPQSAKEKRRVWVPQSSDWSIFGAGSDRLAEALHRLGVKTLVLVGGWTNVCVLASAMDAHDRHFQTIVPPDSVSSPNHQATGLDAMACFADTSNSQSVVAEVEKLVHGQNKHSGEPVAASALGSTGAMCAWLRPQERASSQHNGVRAFL